LIHQFLRQSQQGFGFSLPHRPVDDSGLAEPAAPRATAEQFQHDPVVNGFQIGNDRLGGKRRRIQIPDDAFGNGRRRVRSDRRYLPKRTVLMVFRPIKSWHVDSRQRRQPPQQPGAPIRPFRLFPGGDGRGKFTDDFFPFADDEAVKKIGQRFRIISARTTAHDQGIRVGAFGAGQRNAAQIQHRQDIGISHFILQGKAHRVEIPQWRLRLQAGQGRAGLPHRLFHIRPGTVGPLGVGILPVVQNPVQDL